MFKNPWHGQGFVEDLRPTILDLAPKLGDLLVPIRDDYELVALFTMFNRPEILDLINAEGDIEHPVPLGMTLLRKVPEFRKLAVKAGFKLLFA